MGVVHMHSDSLNRDFTIDEWCEYSDANPDHGVEVTFGDFGFNANDVCLTPHKLVDVDMDGNRFCVSTAQSPNRRWSYGVDMHVLANAIGYFPRFISKENDGYPSERAAVYAGLEEIKGVVSRMIDELPEKEYDHIRGRYFSTSPKLSALRQTSNKIDDLKKKYNPRQLTLFHFE